MNVRAYLYDTLEFYYPPIDDIKRVVTLAGLSEFFAVLEGYQRKGRPFEITWGSGVMDVEGKEVFAGDKVEIIHPAIRNKLLYPLDMETGIVEYDDGCFVFVSETIPDQDFILDSDAYRIRVLHYGHTIKK